VEATIKVLLGQFKRYPDLPHDVASLDEYCNPRDPIWVDRIGRLKWANGEVVLNFSRKKGTPLRDVIKDDPGFAKWILRSDFPRDVKRIVEDAMDGKWPSPPVPTKPEEQSGQMKQDELGLQE
jgi:DNA polymerase-3 subunit epsilon